MQFMFFLFLIDYENRDAHLNKSNCPLNQNNQLLNSFPTTDECTVFLSITLFRDYFCDTESVLSMLWSSAVMKKHMIFMLDVFCMASDRQSLSEDVRLLVKKTNDTLDLYKIDGIN
ncbi:hypothetical protein EDC96DRAFT_550308 [Choanephora cucurbitarum]|nr:hypothetical protein EDC96DRAFT_550308 [Choanephora cucurbitarum]